MMIETVHKFIQSVREQGKEPNIIFLPHSWFTRLVAELELPVGWPLIIERVWIDVRNADDSLLIEFK